RLDARLEATLNRSRLSASAEASAISKDRQRGCTTAGQQDKGLHRQASSSVGRSSDDLEPSSSSDDLGEGASSSSTSSNNKNENENKNKNKNKSSSRSSSSTSSRS
ncbi:unnamed protein product, partial [Polarella glacialis]